MDKAKPKKLTPNQAEWEKEVRKLTRLMRKAERQEISIRDSALPEQPSRVSRAQLKELRKTRLTLEKEIEAETKRRNNVVETKASKPSMPEEETTVHKRETPRLRYGVMGKVSEGSKSRPDVPEHRGKRGVVTRPNIDLQSLNKPKKKQDLDTPFEPAPDRAITVSIIDKIREELNSIPESRYLNDGYNHNTGTISEFYNSMLDDITASFESDEQLAEYEDYLISVQDELFNAIEIIINDSDAGRVAIAVDRIAAILLARALSIDELKEFEGYKEQWQEMNGDIFWV